MRQAWRHRCAEERCTRSVCKVIMSYLVARGGSWGCGDVWGPTVTPTRYRVEHWQWSPVVAQAETSRHTWQRRTDEAMKTRLMFNKLNGRCQYIRCSKSYTRIFGRSERPTRETVRIRVLSIDTNSSIPYNQIKYNLPMIHQYSKDRHSRHLQFVKRPYSSNKELMASVVVSLARFSTSEGRVSPG